MDWHFLCWCWQRLLLRHIRAIAAEAKQQLMNAFRREMTLQLVAVAPGDKSCSELERLRPRKKAAQKHSNTDEAWHSADIEY